MARARKPRDLSATQLAVLDRLYEHGSNVDGHVGFPRRTADVLHKLQLIAEVRTGVEPIVRDWKITERGRAERARAHQARKESR